MEGELPECRLKMEMELDRISKLPSNVIDQILLSLRIQEAVKTSVLSCQWRYRWTILLNLVFDHDPIENYGVDRAVDHVLLNHVGPISKFYLSHPSVSFSDIARWILYLSRNSIKELTISVWGEDQHYKMHSSFYSCQDLIHLDISQCLLKLPPTFKGFGSLKSLEMDSCTMSDDTFENMVARCPLLESLTLRNSYFSHLKINAPKLQWLQIEGQFEDITLVNASSLTVAIIDRYDVQVQLHSSSSNLLKLFAHLPQIQQFSVDRHSISYFSVGVGLLGGKLRLRYIFMRLSLYKMDNMLTALCLLRSSPALEELQMWQDDLSDGGKVKPNLWLDENESCPLAQLRHVRITGLALHNVPAEPKGHQISS